MKRGPSIIQYDRDEAVRYAHKWALKRNQEYLDFEKYGGDCTNFASQVIYSGARAMNYTPIYGWYYLSGQNRSASWTGVDFLYDFLIKNEGVGPFAEIVDVKEAQPGDIAQLSFHGGDHFNHSPVIIQTGNPASIDNILIAAHTDDQDYYALSNYNWVNIRFIHILGVRWV